MEVNCDSGPIVYDGLVLADGPWTGVARAFLTGIQAWLELEPNQRAALLLPAGVAIESLPPALATAHANQRLQVVPHPLAPALSQDESNPRESTNVAHESRLPQGAWSRWRRDRNRCSMLPRLLKDLRCSVFHAPVTAIPRQSPCPMIATVHDIPWISAPALPGEPRSLRATRGARAALRRALHCADAIIVPSERTRQDVAQANHGGRSALDQVHCIPHAVVPPETPASLTALTGPFVVLGDPRRPRKNAALLQQAWVAANAQDPSLPELEWIGPGTERGFVSEAEKYACLRRARALVHVSVFEGFGLPIVEAMMHGVPVLAAREPTIAEVGGKAIDTVDPIDASSIAEGLLRIHRDEELRERLHRLGLMQSKLFGPAVLAAAWQRLYAQLIAGVNE